MSTKYEVRRGRERKEVALTGKSLGTPYAQGAVADIVFQFDAGSQWADPSSWVPTKVHKFPAARYFLESLASILIDRRHHLSSTLINFHYFDFLQSVIDSHQISSISSDIHAF